jgi:hypothetical protein
MVSKLLSKLNSPKPLDSPVLISDYPYLYYVYAADPLPTSTIDFYGYENFMFFWWNTVTNDVFYCIDDTEGALVWVKIAAPQNILAMINSQGWGINTPRAYTLIVLALNTPRTPSSSLDTFVACTVNSVLTLLQSSTITAQVNTGAGYFTIATFANSGIAINATSSLSFMVPAAASYKIVVTGTGTNTITSLMELTM